MKALFGGRGSIEITTFEDIEFLMTHIPDPIRYEEGTEIFRHTNNETLRQLWGLCDLADYEAIPQAMRLYFETRKIEIFTSQPVPNEPEFFYQPASTFPSAVYPAAWNEAEWTHQHERIIG